ncbi:major facilitator superfamily protein [Stylonychia lemnae]|uniref:Lysosomal dipeptide transporter MFSD1 n=1 Tax=Stylonychia lemnae TaxID=5949 RepID=A0A078A6A7_STYLE|nr:major facilitator superfamily protein [Stylonychia lemnae]|eukprot:CDW77739.1 major facilitator superfamily protein [Stylonychia lemnae]
MITPKSVQSQTLELPLIEAKNLEKQRRIILNPQQDSLRYWVLLITCYSKFANYYTNENPASIKQEVLYHFKINNLEFGMFFSIANTANIVLALITGICFDKVKIRNANMFCGNFRRGFEYSKHDDNQSLVFKQRTWIRLFGLGYVLYLLAQRKRLNDKIQRIAIQMTPIQTLMGYVAIVSVTLGPLLGFISDKIDKRMATLIFANSLALFVHILFVTLPNSYQPYTIIIPITLFELAIGIFISNLQAAMNEVSPPKMIGLCFGLLNSLQNLSLAVAQIIVGKILDQNSENLTKGFINKLLAQGQNNPRLEMIRDNQITNDLKNN